MILPLHDRIRDRLGRVLAALYALDADMQPPIVLDCPPDRRLGDLSTPIAFELAGPLGKSPRAIAQEMAGAFGDVLDVSRVAAAETGYLNFFLDRPAFLLQRLPGDAGDPSRRGGGKAIVEHTAIAATEPAHAGHLRSAALGDTLARVLRFRGIAVEAQNYVHDAAVQEDAVHEDTVQEDAVQGGVQGAQDDADMEPVIVEEHVRAHLRTMARMNVEYDLLTWESDLLRLKFWPRTFDVLKAKGAAHLAGEGPHAGCWIMTADEGHETVVVRADGSVTDVGKDIAYQFWKLGILGRDFRYRVFTSRPHGPLWSTCTDDGDDDHPLFGGAAHVYNVIDGRQAHRQTLLKHALVAAGHPEGAERSHHVPYAMPELSAATRRELRDPVNADDLLDALEAKAAQEVGQRDPELADDERRRVADMVATAAVRYFMIKFSRSTPIAIDLDAALGFEGESGPYIQYAAVRAATILRTLEERDSLDEASLVASLSSVPPSALTGENGDDELWSLVLEAARLDEIGEQAVRTLDLQILAKYAFGLAQRFNAFYHRAPILSEERCEVRRWRAGGIIYLRRQLTHALELMGVGVPPRM